MAHTKSKSLINSSPLKTQNISNEKSKILHDLNKIARAIKYCKHDCFLVGLFDNLYSDIEKALGGK